MGSAFLVFSVCFLACLAIRAVYSEMRTSSIVAQPGSNLAEA